MAVKRKKSISAPENLDMIFSYTVYDAALGGLAPDSVQIVINEAEELYRRFVEVLGEFPRMHDRSIALASNCLMEVALQLAGEPRNKVRAKAKQRNVASISRNKQRSK